MTTIYVSIGNSDDKLSQRDWAVYLAEFVRLMRSNSTKIYGEWFSAPDSPRQNACIAIELSKERVGWLRGALLDLRTRFCQDSVAWAEVPETEFV